MTCHKINVHEAKQTHIYFLRSVHLFNGLQLLTTFYFLFSTLNRLHLFDKIILLHKCSPETYPSLLHCITNSINCSVSLS